VVVDGVTGFVCSTLTEMVAAVPQVREIERRACRSHVEQHFSGATMVDGYERAYARLLGADSTGTPSTNVIGALGRDVTGLARS
jgi:hypothetical protein